MKAQKFVVTGATGHLGRSVVHRLAKLGEVVALSRSGRNPEPPFGESAAPNVRAVPFDLESEMCVETLRRDGYM